MSNKLTLDLPPNRTRGQRYSITLKDNKGVSVESITKADSVDDSAAGLCFVCWEQPRNSVFLPCGHIVCCFDCGWDIYLRRKSCPICRKSLLIRPYKIYI